MDFLIRTIGAEALMSLLPMILNKVGLWLRNKDANNTGKDDVLGLLLQTTGDVIGAFQHKQNNSFRKSLIVAKTTIDRLLQENGSERSEMVH